MLEKGVVDHEHPEGVDREDEEGVRVERGDIRGQDAGRRRESTRDGCGFDHHTGRRVNDIHHGVGLDDGRDRANDGGQQTVDGHEGAARPRGPRPQHFARVHGGNHAGSSQREEHHPFSRGRRRADGHIVARTQRRRKHPGTAHRHCALFGGEREVIAIQRAKERDVEHAIRRPNTTHGGRHGRELRGGRWHGAAERRVCHYVAPSHGDHLKGGVRPHEHQGIAGREKKRRHGEDGPVCVRSR